MESYVILPRLGLKTNVPQNDVTLFQSIGDRVAATHCVDCNNIVLTDERGTTSKGPGKSEWSNSAVSTTTTCLGIFEMEVAGTITHWVAMGDGAGNGRIFRYDSSNDPVEINDGVGGGTEYADDVLSKYVFLQFGGYMIFCDNGEHTPYCSDSDDTNLTKLVDQDTEYKPKYIEQFQRRIIGANIDTVALTDGGISIIWAEADGGGIPIPGTDCTFGTGDPPANHLFRPIDDPITGIKRFRNNACFLYGDNGIDSIDYYASYTNPFGIRNLISGEGATNHHSIVSDGTSHFLFNANYGFCEFQGGAFPHGGRPISEQIEDLVATISRAGYPHIVGSYIPNKRSIYWTVPLAGSSTPTHILKFHLEERAWTKSNIVTYWIDNWSVSTGFTFTELLAEGYTTFDDVADNKWMDFAGENKYPVLSSTDGKVYTHTGTSDAGSDFTGSRTEPIMDFGRPNDMDLLEEIWFGLSTYGNFNLTVKYRGGRTATEARNAAWETLPSMSCNNPQNAVVRLAKANVFHQIQYSTTAKAEGFGINQIEFRYIPEGRY